MTVERRVAIVTGAAGGLGSSAVKLFLERGVNVACVDRDLDLLTTALDPIVASSADGAELLYIAADVGDPDAAQDAVSQTVNRFGTIDGLYNIAGWFAPAPIVEATVDDFDLQMRVNVRGTWLFMKFALPHLAESGGGAIVNTGSYQATHGKANCAPYAGAKHAVVGMTTSIALEYATRNVRANVVCPGAMDTPMIRKMMASLDPDDPSAGERQLLADIPQGRMGQTSEVAGVGVWLILDAPHHVTGQVITVDGGKSAA